MNDEYEVSLLSTKFINKYDMDKTICRLIKFMEEYKKLEFQSSSETCLLTAKDFSQIFVDRSFNNDTYFKVDKKIDAEKEYNEISYKISIINKKMTAEEKAYFSIVFRDMKTEYVASNIIGRSRNGLKIIRNSCALKIAIAFNLDVLKSETIIDE